MGSRPHVGSGSPGGHRDPGLRGHSRRLWLSAGAPQVLLPEPRRLTRRPGGCPTPPRRPCAGPGRGCSPALAGSLRRRRRPRTSPQAILKKEPRGAEPRGGRGPGAQREVGKEARRCAAARGCSRPPPGPTSSDQSGRASLVGSREGVGRCGGGG